MMLLFPLKVVLRNRLFFHKKYAIHVNMQWVIFIFNDFTEYMYFLISRMVSISR